MSVRQLNRREFLRNSAMVVAGSLLAACMPAAPAQTGGGAGAEQPAQAGVTVQYWVGWGGNYTGRTWDALRETAEFKEAIGNNTFEIKGSVPTEVMLTAVAGGTPPDGASNIQYLDYMARGVLAPIDDLMANSTVFQQEHYLPDSWDLGFYQGAMYGVPANEGFLRYGLIYNASMVAEAGLDPDNPPQTWGECLGWHEKLTQFDNAGNLLQIGLDPYDAMGGGLWISDGFYVPLAWGWDWFDDETGEFHLDNEQMIDALETMGEFVKMIGPDNLTGMRQVEGQGTWGGSYKAEVQAMMIDGYWRPGEVATSKPEVSEHTRASWALVPTSRSDAKIQSVGGHYVIFFKDAQNREPMFRIAEFLNTDPAMDEIYEATGWLPGRIPYLATVDTSIYPGLDFYFKSMEETTDWHEISRCPITEFVETEFALAYEAQFRGEKTAAEAAADLQRRCEEEYKAAGFGS
jgi:maltose-binding protein MalE